MRHHAVGFRQCPPFECVVYFGLHFQATDQRIRAMQANDDFTVRPFSPIAQRRGRPSKVVRKFNVVEAAALATEVVQSRRDVGPGLRLPVAPSQACGKPSGGTVQFDLCPVARAQCVRIDCGVRGNQQVDGHSIAGRENQVIDQTANAARCERVEFVGHEAKRLHRSRIARVSIRFLPRALAQDPVGCPS